MIIGHSDMDVESVLDIILGVIRGYRTVSLEALLVLAGMTIFHL